MHRANLDTLTVADFEASVQAQRVKGAADKACYGLVFRRTSSDYYWFDVCDSQKFSVSLSKASEWIPLLDWTDSSAIKANQANWLTVVAKGSQFTFYINQKKVGSVSNDSLPTGSVGLGIELGANNSATYQFDNLVIRAP